MDEPAEADLILSALLYAVHFTDRLTFARLRLAGRDLFMPALLHSLTKESNPEWFRGAYNEAQTEYSQFKEFLPQSGHSPKGTLCWEAAKRIVAGVCPDNPELIPLIALHTSQTVVLLARAVEECITAE